MGRVRPALQLAEELVDVGRADRPGDRDEPRLDQVFLARGQDDRRLLADQGGDERELRLGQGHRATAAGRPVFTRLIRTAAIRSSGSTSSARLAPTTAPGMPQTTEVASSWARISAPASLSTFAPPRPSCPIPVSTVAYADAP